MVAPILTMALLMGLTGSLHCAGMCGPIIWVMPFNFMSGLKKWLSILLYHVGRMTTYAVLAFVLYSFRSVFEPQLQQYISIALGVVLLIAGVISFIPNKTLKTGLPWTGFVKKHLGKFIGKPNPGSLLIAGILNGLLPCGLVYMAMSAAIVAPDRLTAVAAMYAFGIGTTPMLLAITVLKKKVNFLHTGHIRKMVPIAMFVFGALFVLRGMNLGIPYLSPKLEVTQHEVKASCCHKNK